MNHFIFYFIINIILTNFITSPKITHKCVHDQKLQEWGAPFVLSPEQKAARLSSGSGSSQSIRITADLSNLDQLSGANAASKQLIVDQITLAKAYFAKLLKVNPQALPNTFFQADLSCNGVSVPAADVSVGISNSDLHIYVRYVNDVAAGYVAYGGACLIGGPYAIFGTLTYNIAKLTSMATQSMLTSSYSSDFQQLFEVTKHEFLHILGFSQASMSSWIASPSGNSNYSTVTTTTSIRSISTALLSTPAVLSTSKSYYSCTSLAGMQLENQAGTVNPTSSHWEKTIVNNELMSPLIQQKSALSSLTLALLKDTNWYTAVNDSLAEPFFWGKSKGCDFFNLACLANPLPSEFLVAGSSNQGCDFFNQGHAIAGKDPFSDDCYYLIPQPAQDCFASSISTFGNQAYESFSDTSRCFISDYLKSGASSTKNSRCYSFTCTNSNTQIQITIHNTVGSQTQQLQCINNNQVLSSPPLDLLGTLTCPSNLVSFCQEQHWPCPCSKSGFCYFNSNTNALECSCLTGHTGSTCSACISHYFMQASTQSCAQCHSSCLSCQGPTQNECTACISTNFLVYGACVSSCSSGYYGDALTQSCKVCNTACSKCTGPSNNQCTACPAETFLKGTSCISSCTLNEYTDETNWICTPCNAACSQCSGSSATDCTICANNYFLNGKNCVPSCPTGTYSSSKYCNQCHSSCSACTGGTADTCQNCTVGNFLQGSFCGTCPTGQYGNTATQLCNLCSTSCQECIGPLDTHCSLCNTSSVLNGGVCLTTGCPSGKYADSLRKCKPCDSRCALCTDQTNTHCSVCNEGFYQDAGSICLQVCPAGKYSDSATATCLACQSPCSECTGSSGYCTTCITNYVLTSQQACSKQNCHSSCQDCTGTASNQCIQCFSGFFLTMSSTCQQCNQTKCLTCQTTEDTCTSCKVGAVLDGINNQCNSICSASCTECIGSLPQNCTKCPTNAFLFKASSGSTQGACLPCDASCLTCAGSNSTCTSCPPFFKLQGTTCKPDCDTTCLTCSGPMKTECISCNSTTYLFDGQCFGVCPKGYYPNVILNRNCLLCHPNCAICTDPTDYCPECSTKGNFQHIKGQCVDMDLLQEEQQRQNAKCHFTCESCFNTKASGCLTCAQSRKFIPFPGQTVLGTCECPRGTTDLNQPICEKNKDAKTIEEINVALSVISVTCVSIASLINGNPLTFILLLDQIQTISQLQYVNHKNPFSLDSTYQNLYKSNINTVIPSQLSFVMSLFNSSNNGGNSTGQGFASAQLRSLSKLQTPKNRQLQTINENDNSSLIQDPGSSSSNNGSELYNQYNPKLLSNEKSPFFFANAFTLIIIIIASWIMAFFARCLCWDAQEGTAKYQFCVVFYFSFALWFFVQSSSELTLLIFMQLENLSFNTSLNVISSLSALLGILYFCVMVFFMIYAFNVRKVLQLSNEKRKFQWIVNNFLTGSTLQRNYLIFQIFRKLLTSIVLVYLDSSSLAQMILITIVYVIYYFIYIKFGRIFKDDRVRKLQMLTESLVFLIYIVYFILIAVENPDTEVLLSKIILLLVILLVISYIAYSFIQFFYVLKDVTFQYQIKKMKIEKLQQQIVNKRLLQKQPIENLTFTPVIQDMTENPPKLDNRLDDQKSCSDPLENNQFTKFNESPEKQQDQQQQATFQYSEAQPTHQRKLKRVYTQGVLSLKTIAIKAQQGQESENKEDPIENKFKPIFSDSNRSRTFLKHQ